MTGWVGCTSIGSGEKKDEVNASERKIGGADLGPVTQLFTENYMVRFLLENSLGAWWAALGILQQPAGQGVGVPAFRRGWDSQRLQARLRGGRNGWLR